MTVSWARCSAPRARDLFQPSSSSAGLRVAKSFLDSAPRCSPITGFASLALSYCAAPGTCRNTWLGFGSSTFRAALRWLPGSAMGRALAAWRSSVAHAGGARPAAWRHRFPRFAKVVAYCPSNVLWCGYRERPNRPRFRLGTARLPRCRILAPRVTARPSRRPSANDRSRSAPSSRATGRAGSRERSATIKVEQIAGSVVVFSGDDDRLWPAGT